MAIRNSATVFEGKLTKKNLHQFKTGFYLVSNSGTAPDKPLYAGEIASPREREAQWKRIVESGADQRLCLVFNNLLQYKQWLSNLLPKA